MTRRLATPLHGRRIAVTRAPEQAEEILELLRMRGASPIACATIDIVPPATYRDLDARLAAIANYDWVAFTSANAVTGFAGRAAALGVTVPSTVRLAAVGKATARALAEQIRAADFRPSKALAEALGTEMPDVRARRVLFPRGELAGETLGQLLRARGATVDDVVVYRTARGRDASELARLVRARCVDAILFMSGSSVRYLLDALRDDANQSSVGLGGAAAICIGPETAQAARDSGVVVSAVANEQTSQGLVEALEEWFGREDDATRS
jgi:uroporphyrinogen-III synthase